MLRHFPDTTHRYPHKKRDYVIALFTFCCVAICLITDATASIEKQQALGVCGWIFLVCLLAGENREVRTQVVIAIIFATIGEHFASPYMQGYTYRFGNVPAYVPPGHGMVYLTAVALARSGLFLNYARTIAIFVVLVCGVWSVWGVSSLPEQGDSVGALLYCVFLGYLFKGRSPMVYLAAFFITTWLELIGTYEGTWKWAAIDPVLQLPQGNPPSGVAAWYCLVDAVAIGGAPYVFKSWQQLQLLMVKVGKKKNDIIQN